MIAIYARVSTEEQARKGYSLQDQIRECRKLAGCEDIIEYVDEGISGEILDRPQLSRLRKDVAQGKFSKVLCLDPDRLSRKLMNQLILSEEIEKKSALVFVNGEYGQSPEGKLFYQLRGAISEFEKAKINERTSRGRREKARQGHVVRDYGVYGYDYDINTQQMVVNPLEAEMVKTIFRLFAGKPDSAAGINGIAKYLTEQGVPTKRGAKGWHRQVVRQLLMNRAYIGEFYQNRWNCEGMLANRFLAADDRVPLRQRPSEEWIQVPCPPIIDREIFFYVQKLLEESRRRWSGKNKHSYLLSGLVRCGTCGNTLTGRKSKNWGVYVLEYSDIKGTAGAKNRGCGNRVKAELLDRLVWDMVVKQLKSLTAAELPVHDTAPLQGTNVMDISHRLSEIQKARSNLIQMMSVLGEELGEAGLEDIRRRLRQINAEEASIVKTRDLLLAKQEPEGAAASFRNTTEAAWDYYILKDSGNLTFEDKQYLIRSLVKEIIVYKNEIRITGF